MKNRKVFREVSYCRENGAFGSRISWNTFLIILTKWISRGSLDREEVSCEPEYIVAHGVI